jgi:GT2 family glycosyltransferase
MYPHVSIIILNWNGWKDTIACLESLFKIDYPNFSVINVDNGSTDSSVTNIREFIKQFLDGDQLTMSDKNSTLHVNFREWSSVDTETSTQERNSSHQNEKHIVLLKNEKNDGYAEGNNIGIRFAISRFNPEYILILNNDTIVNEKFLTEMIKVSEICPEGGFFGPKTYYYDFHGKNNILNSVGERVAISMVRPFHPGDKKVDSGEFDKIRIMDFITGSCLLVKRNVLDQVGLLNPDYFLYWEDVDWALRGKKLGYQSVYVPKAVIWHKIMSSNIGYTSYYFYTRNRFVLSKENAKRWQQMVFLFYFFTLEFWVSSYIQLLYYRSCKRFFALIHGVKKGIKYFISHELN